MTFIAVLNAWKIKHRPKHGTNIDGKKSQNDSNYVHSNGDSQLDS